LRIPVFKRSRVCDIKLTILARITGGLTCFFHTALITLVACFVSGSKERVFSPDSDVAVNKHCQAKDIEELFEVGKFKTKQFVHRWGALYSFAIGYIINYLTPPPTPYFHHTRIEPQLKKGALQGIVHSVSV